LNEELPKPLFDYLLLQRTTSALLPKIKAGIKPQLLVNFGEGFVADEAGFLLMLLGYFLKAMPDGSGKLREKVKRPGMKKGAAPNGGNGGCWNSHWRVCWKARVARVAMVLRPT
jgi:hypothetical protein